jgi:hypothetical protein
MKRSQGNWSKKGGKNQPKVYVSFENLDIQQGQTLMDWNKSGIALPLLNVVAALSKITYSQAITDGLVTEYDDQAKFGSDNMPKSSKWKYPVTISSPDIKWCKIRLGSTRRVIGFMKGNVFHAVFLDENHEFYPTEPKNT